MVGYAETHSVPSTKRTPDSFDLWSVKALIIWNSGSLPLAELCAHTYYTIREVSPFHEVMDKISMNRELILWEGSKFIATHTNFIVHIFPNFTYRYSFQMRSRPTESSFATHIQVTPP